MDAAAVRITNLFHSFGRERILHGLTFDIPQGSIVGLLGPSGSGKTTLIRCIAGLLRPSEGIVEVFGTRPPNPSLARDIGYMAQADALYEDLSASQNLMFFASLFGIRGKAAKQRCDEVLELSRLDKHRHKAVRLFSGGMRKRLSLAITLLHRPRLLILDEPTVGIDPILRAEFWDEFRSLKQGGVSLIVSTHVMDEAQHCDRLGMLFEGRMMAWDSPGAIMQNTKSRSIEEAFLSLQKSVPEAIV